MILEFHDLFEALSVINGVNKNKSVRPSYVAFSLQGFNLKRNVNDKVKKLQIEVKHLWFWIWLLIEWSSEAQKNIF